MKIEQKKAYREPEQLRDILKRVLKNFIPNENLKPFKPITAKEQTDKEV